MSQKAMELYNDNVGFIAYEIRSHKYYAPGYTEEDFIQIGCIALWRAALDFDETKGYKFWTLAIKYIRMDISLIIRKVQAGKGRICELNMRSLSEVLDINDKGDSITLGDTIPCDENIEETSNTKVMLENIFNKLSSKHSYLLKEYYLKDRTLADLAKEFNTTPTSIGQWTKAAMIEARKASGISLAYEQYYKQKNSANNPRRRLKAS